MPWTILLPLLLILSALAPSSAGAALIPAPARASSAPDGAGECDWFPARVVALAWPEGHEGPLAVISDGTIVQVLPDGSCMSRALGRGLLGHAAISSDGRHAGMSGDGAEVVLWSESRGVTRLDMPDAPLRGSIRALGSSDSPVVVVYEAGLSLQVLNGVGGTHRIRNVEPGSSALAISDSGDLVVACRFRQPPVLYRTLESRREPLGTRAATAVDLASEAGLIALAHEGGDVSLWSAQAPSCLSTWQSTLTDIDRIVISGDGRWVAVSQRRAPAGMQVYDRLQDVVVASRAGGRWNGEFSPASDAFALTSETGDMTLSGLPDWKTWDEARPHHGAITHVAWSPDGRRVATASIDGSIALTEAPAPPDDDAIR